MLREHYTQNIENEALYILQSCPPRQDCRVPFGIASSWAKGNLGRRLQPESLDQTQAVIIAKLADLMPGTRSAEQEDTTSEPEQHPQVHAPPATCATSKNTASTMTDPIMGDWSTLVDRERGVRAA